MTQPTAAAPLLEVRGISRNFGPVQALDSVSFTVNRGEVLGLIGEKLKLRSDLAMAPQSQFGNVFGFQLRS